MIDMNHMIQQIQKIRMVSKPNGTGPNISTPIRLITLAGAALTIASVAGCGGSDDAQAAVKEAGRSFTSVSAGDANATPTYSEQTYRATEQDLAQHAGDSNGYAEAAAVGVAMAKKGQAALASQRAAQAENQALYRAREIRGMINEWLTMNAIAQAAGMFDPSAEITEIRSIIELRRDDIESYQRQMAQISQEIAQHEAKTESLRERSKEQRNQAGALELQMPRVSAQEAARLAEQVREFSLRADQFELEAVRIDGVVGQLRPGAREISLNVDKAGSQIQLLEKAIEELNTRAQQSQQDASEARTAANAALERLNTAVGAYQIMRDTEVEDANQEAISLARGAINAVRDARDVLKQIAALNKADAQQLLAEFTMRQAAGEREEAQLYMALSESGISGDWDSRVQAATAKADEFSEAAQQSYLDAASSLRSARMRGDVSDRIESTAQRLEELGGMEPEPDFDDEFEEDTMDDAMDNMDNAMLDISPEDLADMTMEDIAAMLPEDMRDTLMEQFQAQMDMLASMEDPDALYEVLDLLDEQAAAQPAEFAIGFDWIRMQIQARIDELESDG